MIVKIAEQKRAIELRKQGKTYLEIRQEVRVAKSTLSLWLRQVGLAKAQKQRITQKRLDAALIGALRKRENRIALTKKVKQEAAWEIGRLDKKVFWLAGAALYWAEGSKQKEHNVASGVIFSNSDPAMVKYFCEWLKECCGIGEQDINIELCIHNGCDVEISKKYWAKIIPFIKNRIIPVRFKKGNSKSFRKNKGKNYFGLLRVVVRRSTILNRRIAGWFEELYKQFMSYSGVV